MFGLATVGLTACSLFTDLSGLSSNVVIVNGEGGSPTIEGGTAGGEAGAGDGGARDGDAGDGSTLPGASPCTDGAHSLCVDFEDPSALADFQSDVGDVGSIAVSTGRATSGTHALRAELPRHATSDPAQHVVVRYRDIPHPWTHLTAEFSMFIEDTAWEGGDVNLALALVQMKSQGADYDAFLWIQPTSSQLGATSTGYRGGPPIPTNEWMRVRLEMDPQGRVKGRFGATQLEDVVFTASAPGDQPSLVVGLGLFGFNHPAPAVVVYYDDLTIDF